MRSFVVAVALFACACGDVLKATDAGVVDAYQPDSPVQPPMCSAGEMVCNGACANVMSSELYCGSCTTQCSPTQGCLNGACVPANTSCSRVKELEPDITDGAFRNPNNSTVFYCDFTARKQYEFGLGAHNTGYFQYTIMSATSFDDTTKAAFIGYYNRAGGIPTISAFATSTCCITQPNLNELTFGPPLDPNVPTLNYLSLAQNGQNVCNITYSGIYQIMKNQSAPAGLLTTPLAADFFTTYPAGEANPCGESTNIGLFMKTSMF